MASAIHAPQRSYPTPSFSRDSTQSFTSSQKQLYGEVSSSQSVNSSPTKSPPPSRGHPKKMSFSMGSYAPQNGLHLQHNGPRGYNDINGTMSYQQQYPGGQKPQIYTAVYSGVQVYEMEVNGVFLMRRRHDSWLNATQILKVAGIDKGKRTKVLEKEILAGEHEKVQGGYGKYQGTWVNYQRGREFCRQYGVEELLRPLLEYDMGQDGVTQAGQGIIDTPTKEQAMAAQRKKLMYNGGIENRPPTQSPNATFFKSISATAANAVSAMNKTRIDSPGPRPASGNKRPQPARRPSMQMASQESLFPGSSQQSMQSLHSEVTVTGLNGHLDPAFGSQSAPYYTNPNQAHDSSFSEPPRKRARRSSMDPFSQETNGGYETLQEDTTLVEDNGSFYHQAGHANRNIDQAIIGVQPLPQPTSKRDLDKQQLLVSLFLDPAQTDFRDHATLSALSGEEMDIPMDGTAHTALHWAATLGRTTLIRALIARGASIYRVNGGGETALIRAALTTNNLDQGTFPELLELLGPTIEMRDGRGRTVLHHIAVSSAVKGRSAACKYYLESLLEFVVRQGSATNSQHPSFNGPNDSTSYPRPKSIGLARFMSEIVNAQDMSGDTALNLAARIGNKSIIQQLLEVGANPTIPNYGGLKPVDFGVGGDPEPSDSQLNSQSQTTHEKTAISKIGDASRELTSSFTTLITTTESSFRSEIKQKQSQIDAAHAKLRDASARLAEDKRELAELERKTEERKLLKLRIANLRRANEDMKNTILRNGTTVKGAHEVKVGDADAGLEIDLTQLPPLLPDGSLPTLTPAQERYLASLPSLPILNARISAYSQHNAGLEQEVSGLRNRSVELDQTLKKIVLSNVGLGEEEMTDEMWAKVLQSWREDMKEGIPDERVRELLKRMRGVGV